MGKTSATYQAIKNALVAAHGDDFEAIVLSLRTPFDAVEAGDLCRSGKALIVGVTADTTLTFSGAAKRVISGVAASLFVVSMLEGRTGKQDEEDVLVGMFDAVDDVVATLEDITAAPATTFAALRVDQINTIYDPDGNYVAVEIQITASVVRV